MTAKLHLIEALRARSVAALCLLCLLCVRCPASANLVSAELISDSRGVIREQRISDGVVPATNAPVDDFTAALFLAPDAFVEYDLGRQESIGYVQLHALGRLSEVLVSTDGSEFSRLALNVSDSTGAMSVYTHVPESLETRYIRLQVAGGHRQAVVSELLVLAKPPAGVPVELDVQLPATYEAAVDQALAKRHATGWISILVAAGAVLLMTLGWRLGARRTVAVSLFCAALGTAGWLGYGSLHGDTRFLHAWEITHYYLGPKYFTELGHAGLYDALARHEFEQGRGSILQHAGIRDLADNSTHQGAVYDAVSQYRPDTFTASRWQAFGRDADRIRRLLVYRHFHSILGDHGYNGTPTLTWLLHHLTNLVPAGVRAFRALAVIDLLCLLFGLISIWWAFGPRAGGLAFVVAGLCPYWDISFTGGSIGRYLWFLSLCSGMALTQRKQFFAGALLVTLSGCLRLFPLVFLFFPAVEFFEHLFRGTLEPRHRSAFCGVATALVCALLLPLVSFGPGIFVDFFHNTRIHGVLPPANHLGLGVICSRGLGASVLDFSLDVSKQLVARRLLWALGVAGGLLVALTLYRRQSREKLWERIPLAAPLLFATLPLSSYDYLWCVVLVPFAAEARSRTAMIGALLVVAGVCAQAFADVGLGHTVMSVVFLCFIAAFFLDLLRRDGPAQPISADATSP